MTAPSVSVIVVSRGRPDALLRCLAGIEQLDHPAFELVVVADPDGVAALGRADLADRVKCVGYDTANISAARNLGLQVAAGDVVVFIDDDAVPEPTWLGRLTAPFADADVSAAGGYVRGRNGISFQNRARRVDGFGRHRRLSLSGDAAQVFRACPGDAIKTEGTNCAFRRDMLMAMGGFDPAFAFFLDETDVNLRLAGRGAATAIVPGAEVHHGFAASARRTAQRMPRTLHDIGASQMVFLRKHAPDADHAQVLADLRAEQRARLLRHMVAGTCEPRDVARLMATLEDGLADGVRRPFGTPEPLAGTGEPFLLFRPRVRFVADRTLAGRIWQRRRLRAEAAKAVARGQRVSLYLFSPTTVYHRVAFRLPGYWEQTGGIWGRSDRRGPVIRRATFASRLKVEQDRVAGQRLPNQQ